MFQENDHGKRCIFYSASKSEIFFLNQSHTQNISPLGEKPSRTYGGTDEALSSHQGPHSLIGRDNGERTVELD